MAKRQKNETQARKTNRGQRWCDVCKSAVDLTLGRCKTCGKLIDRIAAEAAKNVNHKA